MKDAFMARPWITADEALDFLLVEAGLLLTEQEFLELCSREHCEIHLDCSFSAGHMDDYQYLAQRVKGAGYCKLLEARDIPTQQEKPLLSAKGTVIVQGVAWVYSLERKEAQREEGIWRFDFGDQPRPFHFSRTEIHRLCRRVKLNRDCRSSAALLQTDAGHHIKAPEGTKIPDPKFRTAAQA